MIKADQESWVRLQYYKIFFAQERSSTNDEQDTASLLSYNTSFPWSGIAWNGCERYNAAHFK